MIDFRYSIVRSLRRRTIGITVKQDGTVEVRIPRFASVSDGERFLREKEDWVRRSIDKMRTRGQQSSSRDWESVKKALYPWIKSGGLKMFGDKVRCWADKMGVTYSRVTVKDMSSRWGSCSSKHNLSFSWKVFVMPEHLVDYLVVHELAHIKHMDHSPEFWAEVGTYIPDYKARKKEFGNYI